MNDMYITSIKVHEVTEDSISVTIVVEDAVVTRPATLYDPPELGPAQYEATVPIECLPEADYSSMETEQIERVIFNSDLDLYDWRICKD